MQTKMLINGEMVTGSEPSIDVFDPSTGGVITSVATADEAQVDAAVRGSAEAFATFSQTTVTERLDLLQAIAAEYKKRSADIAAAITQEMGAPKWLADSSGASTRFR